VPPSTSPSARLNRLLQCLDHDTGNVALRKDAVREACETRQWDMARELVDVGLWLHPDDAELLAQSGFVYLHEQRYADAGLALSAALANGVNAPEVRYNLAFACFMQKRYSQALELSSDPLPETLPLAFLLRARCLHHLQRPDEAIVSCRARLAAAPTDVEAQGLLALLLQEQGRHEEAQSHIDAALAENPRQLEAMLAQAGMQRDRHDYDAAQASFENVLSAHSDCGRAWLGQALIKLGRLQFEAARQDIEHAAACMPEHIGTWHVLAWTEIMRGDVIAAELAFDRAMALDRNFAETHGGLAVIAALHGRESDARANIKRALRLDAQSMAAQYAELLLLQRADQHEQARAVLETFMARPVAGGDIQLRDLVALHIRYLQAREDEAPCSALN
jgi:tetratricopeptide (TPR) repeat protein